MKLYLGAAALAALLAGALMPSAQAHSFKYKGLRQPGAVMLNPQPLPPGPCRNCGSLQVLKYKQLWLRRHRHAR